MRRVLVHLVAGLGAILLVGSPATAQLWIQYSSTNFAGLGDPFDYATASGAPAATPAPAAPPLVGG